MALFQHEDFIILGMLFAKYFPAYIYDFGNGAWGGGSWNGGGGGWLPEAVPKYGTGRGGIISDLYNVDGDDGRPGASDNATGTSDPSLAGGKGALTYAGSGFNSGGFGYGGNASQQSSGFIISAGGGSGWFGGGSAFIDAGGGGGSNYVYSNSSLGLSGAQAAGPEYSPPDWLNHLLWVGIDSDTYVHYVNNKALYDVNTYHVLEYERWRNELGNAFDDFIEYHRLASGNGLILISEPDKMIEYDSNNSFIKNIASVITYTGQSVSWKPPRNGRYHFILWGAQGGTTFYTPPGGSTTYQQYTGGFGGAVGCLIDLEVNHKELDDDNNEIDVDTELFLYVGQKGLVRTKYTRAWNGGGNADGGCTGGGGATDIRYRGIDGGDSWLNNLYARIAVAGGGGGCVGSGNGQEPPREPISGGSNSNANGGGDKGEISIPSDGKLPYFLVNDRSLVYVTIQYFTQAELPEHYDINCTIYINGGSEGILSQDFSINPVSGEIELVYALDQIYPPNTETHWVTISAVVNTNVMFVIPDNGVSIRVETRASVNEPDSSLDPNNKPIFLRLLEKLSLTDLYRVNMILPPEDVDIKAEENFVLVDMFNLVFATVQTLRLSIIEKLKLEDSSRVDFGLLPEDIYTSVVERLLLNDMFGMHLKAVQTLRLSIIEQLNVTDYEEIGGDFPPSDTIIKRLENLNLLEKVKTLLKEQHDIYSEPYETLQMNDFVSVTLRRVTVLRLSITEQLSLIDENNIKEE